MLYRNISILRDENSCFIRHDEKTYRMDINGFDCDEERFAVFMKEHGVMIEK